MHVSEPDFRGTRSATPRGSLRGFHVPLQAVVSVLAGLEAASIVLGSLLGGLTYGAAFHTTADPHLFASLGAIGAVVYVSLLYASNSYTVAVLLRPGVYAGRIAAMCCVCLCIVTAILYLLKISSEFSRGAMLVFTLLMPVLCWCTRSVVCLVAEALLARGLVSGHPVHVLGDRSELAVPKDLLLRRYGLSDRGRTGLSDWSFAREDEIGRDIARAVAAARDSLAREIILLLKPEHLLHVARIEPHLRASPLPVSLLPSSTFRAIEERHGAQPGASRSALVQRAPMSGFERGLKRLVDIVGACLGLVLLAPLLLIVGLIVKLDSAGPAIFRQRRNGFDQRPFAILKFRTMHVHTSEAGVPQARRGDSRVTRVGRVLRRTSIEELPQLINVLRGHMSLVGPRPHALAHDDHFGREIDAYYRRHHVKPGITGWAQINGLRGETREPGQMERRVDFDVWYVNNWSLLLDIKIILRTCFEILAHDAY